MKCEKGNLQNMVNRQTRAEAVVGVYSLSSQLYITHSKRSKDD